MTLHIHKDATVYTADMEKVGSVKRVVIDALTQQTTHIVVKKGFIFPEDRVIPVAAIAKATEGQIDLDPECDVEQFPPFEEQLEISDYETLSESKATRMPFNRYGLYGMPFPVVSPVASTPRERNIPDRSVPLKTGADVVVGDEKIGVFEELLTEKTGVTTHLVVALGILSPVRKAVPIGWVRTFNEDTVRLGVPLGMIEQVNEYQPMEQTI